jgi:hypothetical protein
MGNQEFSSNGQWKITNSSTEIWQPVTVRLSFLELVTVHQVRDCLQHTLVEIQRFSRGSDLILPKPDSSNLKPISWEMSLLLVANSLAITLLGTGTHNNSGINESFWVANSAKLKRLCDLLDSSPLFKDELVTEAMVDTAISTLELTFKHLYPTAPSMVRTISQYGIPELPTALSIPTKRPSAEQPLVTGCQSG